MRQSQREDSNGTKTEAPNCFNNNKNVDIYEFIADVVVVEDSKVDEIHIVLVQTNSLRVLY